MNMEEGELLIEGKIDSLSFINKTDKKDKSLLKKLFK